MYAISIVLALLFAFTSLEAAPLPGAAYGFTLVPNTLIVQNGHTEVVLSLVLLPESKYPGVALKAASKGAKTHITYSKPLVKFIKSLNLTRKDFKPFVVYLTAQVKSAKANPAPFIILLDEYLKTGAAPTFTIDLNPSLS